MSVHDDEVVALLELLGVAARVGEVRVALCLAEPVGGPLKAVVDRLCRLEERLVAADDAPVRDQAQVVESLSANSFWQP